MRIITLCDGSSITGGAEKVAITTAVELKKAGVDSAFFGAEGDLDPLIIANGLQSHSLGLADAYHTASKKELLKRFFWNKEARAKFASFLDGFDPKETVVHVHSFRRILSSSVMAEVFERGFKTVYTLHDFGLVCPNTSYYNFSSEQICPLKPGSLACYRTQCTKKGWPMKAMQMGRSVVVNRTRVQERIDRYVAVSEFSRQIMAPLLPSSAQIDVIHSPVAIDQMPKVDPGASDMFLFVGRFQPEKDPVLFAQAARQAGVRAVFVGDGPETDRIKAANPDAELTGWLPGAQVVERVRSARATVMPSRWYETAGLAAIDALCHGVPAIVSDLCAATEFVTDNHNGMHFKGMSVDDLAAKLASMSVEKSRRLGGQAYDSYWSAPLTVERYLQKLTGIYDSVLGV